MIVPAWIRSSDEKGTWCILGSQPSLESKEQWIPKENIEKITLSEHQVNGLTFGIIVIKESK